jgi:hypothetical protein
MCNMQSGKLLGTSEFLRLLTLHADMLVIKGSKSGHDWG